MPTAQSGFFEWVWFFLRTYGGLFLQGAGVTLLIALTGTLTGFVIGLGVGYVRAKPNDRENGALRYWLRKIVRGLLGVYIEVFRGTPMIVQSMVIYYGSMMVGIIQRGAPVLPAAIFIVSINTGAYMAEIIRGGIISVDAGQKEAATAIGMTHWQAMVKVVLPQAVRNIMPSIGNEFVVNIKDSSVLNVISLNELYFTGKGAAGTYGRYFEAFFVIACIYLVLTFTVTRLLRLLEKKMDGKKNYTIYGSQSDSHASITIHEGEEA